MSSSPWTENVLLFVLFVALSAGSSLWFLYRAYTRYFSSSEIFLAALEKLITANNLDRAGKLCNAIPGGGVIAQLSRRLIKTAQSFTSTSFPEDRSGALRQALAEEEAALQQEERKLSLYKKHSIFWLLCAAALLINGVSTDVSLAVLLGLLFLFYMAERMERTTALHKALVVPKLLHLLVVTHVPLRTPETPPQGPSFTLEITADREHSRALHFEKKSSVIKIGADQSSVQVHLTGDGIAGIHCVLNVSSEKANLIDLGTSIGTSVNNQPITSQDLRAADVIKIGRYTINFSW